MDVGGTLQAGELGPLVLTNRHGFDVREKRQFKAFGVARVVFLVGQQEERPVKTARRSHVISHTHRTQVGHDCKRPHKALHTEL